LNILEEKVQREGRARKASTKALWFRFDSINTLINWVEILFSLNQKLLELILMKVYVWLLKIFLELWEKWGIFFY
jgi:hypothetical protein